MLRAGVCLAKLNKLNLGVTEGLPKLNLGVERMAEGFSLLTLKLRCGGNIEGDGSACD